MPDWDYTPGKLRSYIEERASKVEHCSCGQPGWEAPYGKLNENLRRYRIREHKECDGCRLLKGREGLLEDGLHLLMRLSPRRHARSIGWLYDLLRAATPNDLCQCQLRNLLKGISGEAKRGGRFGHASWRFFTHWELMFGYVAYQPMEKLEAEVVSWLVTRRHNGEHLMGEKAFVEAPLLRGGL